ncbi:hypothetical protein [Pseudomonas sp. PP3]|uniref:hypothetical protein n=1 Tax=Pseudomonas sp. PP3 TaxID=2815936 RepID=UPI001BAF1EE8|nr:hypothetical protein [Pseudomonas sp. PP3]
MNKQASLRPAALPYLQVPESDGDTLNIIDHDEDPTVISKQWPQARLWMHISGIDISGNPLVVDLLDSVIATPEQLANGLNVDVPIDKLINFKNESHIIINARITPDGDTDVSTAISFPTKELLLQTKPDLDETTTFNDQTYGGWEKGVNGTPLQFRSRGEAGYCLYNEITNWVEGIVLQKTFNVVPGRRYEVSAGLSLASSSNQTEFVFSIDGRNSPPYLIREIAWETPTFSAIATSDSITVKLIQNGKQTHRYFIEDLRVRAMPRS